MDYEDVANLTNLTSAEDITPQQSRRFIAQEIVFTIIALMSVCANSFIIHIIFNYKRMRVTPNLLLANWATADLCSLIFLPSAARLFSVLDDFRIPEEFMCVLLETGETLHLVTLIFVLTVLIDWILVSFCKKFSERFRTRYKIVIITIWTIGFLTNCIKIGDCFGHYLKNVVYYLVLLSCYGLILVLVIIFSIYRSVLKCKRKSLNNTLMLTLVTACTVCWFLGYVTFIISVVTKVQHPMVEVIAECAVFCNGIVNFFILYYKNADFRACLFYVLGRSHSGYEEAMFPLNEPIVSTM